jgi:hypothetical protein
MSSFLKMLVDNQLCEYEVIENVCGGCNFRSHQSINVIEKF